MEKNLALPKPAEMTEVGQAGAQTGTCRNDEGRTVLEGSPILGSFSSQTRDFPSGESFLGSVPWSMRGVDGLTLICHVMRTALEKIILDIQKGRGNK